MSDGTGPPGDAPVDLALAPARTAAQANEWVLVLSALGIASRVVRTPLGFVLQVHPADIEHAESELREYLAEKTEAAAARAAVPQLVDFGGAAPLNVALLVALAMFGFYAVTGPARAGVVWFAEGSADAALIRSGELWRTVTALTLHADAMHLVANLLFGTFFLAAVGRSLGPGVSLALVVSSGAGGNLLNALLRSSAHVSIGASTAVFGAVGLLSGYGVARRLQRGDRWRLALAPFAAGVGVLAMIGTGEGRVDVFAHLFGLLVGVPVGLAAGLLMPRPPGPWPQAAAAAIALAVLIGSWRLAVP